MRIQHDKGVLSIQVDGGRWRKVGDVANNTLILYRDTMEHYSEKHKGYGFNCEIINDSRTPNNIKIVELINDIETQSYMLSKKNIIHYGVIDNSESFEKQIFLSLVLIEKLNGVI